jgi:hypothetical protein
MNISTHYFNALKSSLKRGLLPLFLLFFINKGFSTTCTANANGNWNTSSTWSCGQVPACGDTIVISGSVTVTNSNQQNYSACSSPMLVRVNGTLYFQNGFKLRLPCGSQIIVSSGGRIQADVGNGNSNYIEICSDIAWNSGCGGVDGPISIPPFDCVLPITLVSFTAKEVSKGCQLNWVTASEINNEYFLVEKSVDGKNFSEAGKVSGAGNSTSTLYYSLLDEYPYSGVSYYRLKQVDYDGTFAYSDVVAISMDGKDFESLVTSVDYESKSISCSLYCNYTGKLEYHFTDVLGNTVNSGVIESSKGINKLNLSTLRLAQGVYYLTIRNEREMLTRKIFY